MAPTIKWISIKVIPTHYTPLITAALKAQGADLNAPRQIAQAVRKLSDHYINNPDSATPWHTDWAKIAYVAYFFPLNYLRVSAVLRAGMRSGFWQGLTEFSDFGSGLGTVPLAIADSLPGQFLRGLAVESSPVTEKIYKQLAQADLAHPNLSWATKLAPAAKSAGHLTVFSFSLTELPELPKAALASEALAIIEPATHQDGRRLMQLRADLMAQGWYAWAPCTHQEACPLLVESARDWCHDRITWEPPEWYLAIEEHLPMRNRTLTHSYLLMRRQPPPIASFTVARLTGDLQRQKGASKQMVCRGPKREFLSWQHKHGQVPEWPRGALVRLSSDIAVKSNELRPTPDQCDLVGC